MGAVKDHYLDGYLEFPNGGLRRVDDKHRLGLPVDYCNTIMGVNQRVWLEHAANATLIGKSVYNESHLLCASSGLPFVPKPRPLTEAEIEQVYHELATNDVIYGIEREGALAIWPQLPFRLRDGPSELVDFWVVKLDSHHRLNLSDRLDGAFEAGSQVRLVGRGDHFELALVQPDS